MPITFSSDKFNVSYAAGDAKGNSFANPLTFEEVYQYSLAQGLGYVTKFSNTYIFTKGIYFSGASTYFVGTGVNVIFKDMPIGAKIIEVSYSHFRLGYNSASNFNYNVNLSGQQGFAYQIYASGSDIEFNNVSMMFVRIRELVGAGGNVKVNNCVINSDNNTSEAGFGTSTIELTFNTYMGQSSVNNNVTLAKFDNCIFRDTSRLYTQLPGTSINRKLKFLDSSYIYLVMNSYANGDTHNKYLIDCRSDVSIVAQSSSSIAFTAFYNVIFQTSLKINLNTQGNIRIYDKDNNLVKQYNSVSSVDDVLTYKSVECYSSALSSQVTKTTNVKQPFRLEFEPVSSEFQSGSISNFTVTEEVESVIKFDFKSNPAPLTFSLTRLLSRVFATGKKITSSELLIEGVIQHEAELVEQVIITNAARATYRPATNDIFIEQKVDGLFQEAEVISEGVQLLRASSSVVEDQEAVFVNQIIEGEVIEPQIVTGFITETIIIEGDILC